jgi:hypothetical protein
MMPSPDRAAAACLELLERALAEGRPPELAGCAAAALDDALRELARRHGAAAAPLIREIADGGPTKELRKSARLAIYRLSQSGVAVPASPPARSAPPVVGRRAERPVRAWLSGIDGSGSRAAWILFDGGLG